MKFCLYVPPFGPYADALTLAKLARNAEDAGWDGFFIWDHIAGERYPETIVDPWIALTAIALNTKKIRIGALVTPLPRRRPWKVARETVSLDHISGGRLVFGAGIGSGQGEFDNLGEEADPIKRGEMLEEFERLVDFVKTKRQEDIPFDILFRGADLPVNDPERAREIIKPYAKLGVTWWQVNLNPVNFGGELKGKWPVEAMHQRVLQGPPRI